MNKPQNSFNAVKKAWDKRVNTVCKHIYIQKKKSHHWLFENGFEEAWLIKGMIHLLEVMENDLYLDMVMISTDA